MSSWKWYPASPPWHAMLVFALAFGAGVEGPHYYTDLVRGIAVGLALGALVIMLAGRQAALALACAGLLVSSFLMEPRTATGGAMVATHVLSGSMLVLTIWNGLHRVRLLGGRAQIAEQ